MAVCLLYCFLLPSSGEILWHDAGDDNPFTFSLAPDGRPTPLRLANGSRVRSGQVSGLYGSPGGMRVLDGGTNVCSEAWAEDRNFTRARRVLYQDLSDHAGWPTVRVPSGIIALDPRTGRLKFSEGDPDQPLELVKTLRLPHGEPVGVALKRDYAYLAQKRSERSFQVLDIRDPFCPVPVAFQRVSVDGAPHREGDLIVLPGGITLWLLDVAEPLYPRVLSCVWPERGNPDAVSIDLVRSFRLCGPTLYARAVSYSTAVGTTGRTGAAPSSRWEAHDLSSPSRPKSLGVVPEGVVPDLFHAGLGYRKNGETLEVLSVAEPTKPTVVEIFRLRGRIERLAVSGDRLYALLHTRQVAVFFAGRFVRKLVSVTPPLSGLTRVDAFCVDGNRLFVAGQNGQKRRTEIGIYDVDQCSRLRRRATLTGSPFAPIHLAVDRGRLVAADTESGLWVVDIGKALKRATRAATQELRLVPFSERRRSLADDELLAGLWPSTNREGLALRLDGDTALVGSRHAPRTVASVDIKNPTEPAVRGLWRQDDLTFPPLAFGEIHCARSARERSWWTLDLTSPTRSTPLGKFAHGREGTMVEVGRFAYLFTRQRKDKEEIPHLAIYDCHSPTTPFPVEHAAPLPEEFAGPFWRTLVSGARLYAVRNGALVVFDVSAPLYPVPVGWLSDPETRYSERTGLGFHRGLLYVAGRKGGDPVLQLLVYDVTDPREIREVNSIPLGLGHPDLDEFEADLTGDLAGDLFVEGDLLYILGHYGDLCVYGLRSDPSAPKLLDSLLKAAGSGPPGGSPSAKWSDEAEASTRIDESTNQQAGVLHRDHLVCPTRIGLSIYQVRRSPERPAGPLTLEFVPESEHFDKVVRHVRTSMVALDEASAAAIVIRQKGRTLFEWYHGRHSWAPNARTVDEDSRFPVWSLTKAYVTTALGLALDAGRAELDDPVCKFIPEFTGEGKEKVTLRQLATHSSGLKGDVHWLELDLWREPGSVASYSNVGMDLLAFTVGRIMQDGGFGQTLRRRIFEPLGLAHSGFLCPGDDKTLIIPAVTTRQAEPWYDEWGPDGRGMAGLYVSARDLAAFGELYLNEGELNGKRIFRSSTIRLLSSPRRAPGELANAVPWQALAWRVQGDWHNEEQSPDAPRGTFSHTGGTHCYIMVCPALDLVAVKLLNRGYWPHTFDFNGDYRRFCKLVLEAVRERP